MRFLMQVDENMKKVFNGLYLDINFQKMIFYLVPLSTLMVLE